jgi:hypothetical protein
MELVINSLYQMGGVKTPYAQYWEGKVLAFHSLEIVSIEGQVYFFVRVEGRFKALVTHQIYAQYPDAEITEVDDYIKYVPPFAPDNGWEYRGCELKKAADDGKDTVTPIKTYVDYGLDAKQMSLDEEQRIDPITPFIEFMGSMGKGEQFWFQIVIRGATKRYGGKDWKDWARAWIKKVLEENAKSSDVRKVDTGEVDAEGKKKYIEIPVGGFNNLPMNLKQKVESLERNMEKFGFDTGIRAMYIATKDAFKGTRLPLEFTSVIRQFASGNLNSFGMNAFTDDFDYWWQDYKSMRAFKNRKKMFSAYANRAFFYWPAGMGGGKLLETFTGASPKAALMNMTTEELATLFHFPGRVSATPTFTRIESRKAEPPTNLPI